MNNKISLIYIIYLFLFNFLFSQSNQDTSISDISLRTYVENESVALNREVVYVVQLEWMGDLSRYKISEVLDPDVSNLLIRGSGSSNKVTNDSAGNEISIKEIIFYFKPIEMGMAYINGITVRYEDTILDKQESLLASRISVKIVDPIDDGKSANFSQYVFYFTIILFLVIGIFLFFLYKKKKRENEILEQAKISESIELKYLRQLNEIDKLSDDSYKEKLHDITHILLKYLSELYSISLVTMSSKDVLNYLENQEPDSSIYSKLKEFITKSDLLKFAGTEISEADFHQLYDSVEWILEKNKNDNTEKEDE